MYSGATTVRTMTSDPADGEPNAEGVEPDDPGTYTVPCPFGCIWFLEHSVGVTVTVQPYVYDDDEDVWVGTPELTVTDDEPIVGHSLAHHIVWWRINVQSGTVSAENPLVLKATRSV